MDSEEANNAIVKCCQKLDADLQAARKNHPDGGSRERCVANIFAVVQFLRDAGYDKEDRAPFLQILGAFEDLDRGFTPELFQAVHVGHTAPKRPSFEMSQKAGGVAAIYILHREARVNVAQAVKIVAKELDLADSTLAEFRRNMSRTTGQSDKSKHKVAESVVDEYRWFVKTFGKDGQYGAIPPDERAKRLLQSLKSNKG